MRKAINWINQLLDWNEAVNHEINKLKPVKKGFEKFMHMIYVWYLLPGIPFLWSSCPNQVYNQDFNVGLKIFFILTAAMYPFLIVEGLTRIRKLVRKIRNKS